MGGYGVEQKLLWPAQVRQWSLGSVGCWRNSALCVHPHPTPTHPRPCRPEVAAAGKRALGMRYKLLPYLYSAVHAAAKTGAPIMRPLWFNFPHDGQTHRNDRSAQVVRQAFHCPGLCCAHPQG